MACLLCIVLLQSMGVAGMYLLSSSEMESDVYGLLFFDWGWPEDLAQRIDDAGALGTLVGAGLAIPGVVLLSSLGGDIASGTRISRQWLRLLLLTNLCFIASWMLAIAVTQMVRGGAFVEYALGEHAVRFAVPLALALLLAPATGWISGERLRQTSMGLLTLATAATFIVHGYKAICLYGQFTDLILLSSARWTSLQLTQSTAEGALWVIGVVDVVVALLLIGTRWRMIAAYMALWGLITACSRMTAMGAGAWPEVLIRSANWGAPLALLLYHRNRSSQPRMPSPCPIVVEQERIATSSVQQP